MIKRMIDNRIRHQKKIFRLSKSKKQFNENLIDVENQTKKSDNKKTEYICSNR